MADQEDLDALLSGERDLYARDFRDADLSSLIISERDFGRCSFQGATLRGADCSGSDFSGANFFRVKADQVGLRNANCESVVFQNCDFSRADCSGTRFYRSHFINAIFDGAILTGADFRECVFGDGISSFQDSLVNSETFFDKAKGSRAQSRQDAFRFYKLERGEFVRVEHASPAYDHQIARALIAVEDARKSLFAARKADEPSFVSQVGIGHNNPPAPLRDEEAEALVKALDQAEQAIRKSNHEGLKHSLAQIVKYAHQIGAWAAAKADVFADEFAKGLGQEASKTKFWVGLWLILSGHLTSLANIIASLAK